MSAISDSAAENLIRLMFGRITNPFPATYYIALSSTQPTTNGANVTEPTDPSYSRASFDNTTGNWVLSATRSVENDAVIAFPQAFEPWGEYGYIAIYSAPTGGTFYGWSALSAPVTVDVGEIVQLDVADLVIGSPVI